MNVGSALGRLAVTVPFLFLATALLGFFAAPLVPADDGRGITTSTGVLIVTIDPLRAPFEALDDWNRQQGCSSYVVTLTGQGRLVPHESQLLYLGNLCSRYRVQTVLLGGNPSLVPLLGPEEADPARGASTESRPEVELLPAPSRWPENEGLRLGRAPVGNLEEAWAFVNACRSQGLTLDQLLEEGGSLDVASLAAVRAVAADPGFLAAP
jgi:hypothetical protein